MKVTNDGAFELPDMIADGGELPEEWERGGIVTEENDAVVGVERIENGFDRVEVLPGKFLPLRALGIECFTGVNRHGRERRCDPHEEIISDTPGPAWLDAEFRLCEFERFQPKAALTSEKAGLAEFVVAADGNHFVWKAGPQRAERFASALK